ncbi:hypothetical protein ACWF50_10820 [Brucella pseudogrignonensis]|jgi:hypothetical protein
MAPSVAFNALPVDAAIVTRPKPVCEPIAALGVAGHLLRAASKL